MVLSSLSVGHSESRRMTDELGSRQRDLSTSSVTKRANGHWHAIIASSCRWSQREYKRQPVHRINHPFASEPSGGVSLLLFLTLRVRSFTSAGVTARQRWSRSHGRKRNGSREDSHTRSVQWPAPLRASALKEQISLKEYTGDRVFLKMSYHPCVSGCGRSLAPQDGHDHCLTCLGIQHAEEAFVDGSCSSCGDMTISELRNRLRCVKHGGVPLPLPRSGVRPGTKRGSTASGGVRGDLRITVRASPSGVSHPSGTPQPAGVPLVRTGASAEWGTPPVSFGASPNAFSDWGLWFCHTHGNGKYADLLPVCRWRVFWAESPKPIVYRLFSILNSDLIHNNLCFYNVWIYSRLHSATRIIRAACYRKFYFDFPSPLLAYSPLAKPARVPLTQRIPLFHTRIHTFNIVSLLLA